MTHSEYALIMVNIFASRVMSTWWCVAFILLWLAVEFLS